MLGIDSIDMIAEYDAQDDVELICYLHNCMYTGCVGVSAFAAYIRRHFHIVFSICVLALNTVYRSVHCCQICYNFYKYLSNNYNDCQIRYWWFHSLSGLVL